MFESENNKYIDYNFDLKASSYPQEYSNNYDFLNSNHNREVYYNLENNPKPKNFSCEVCNKSFYTHSQYKKHIDEHVDCPFPECSFKAHMKVIEQHIDHQHMLVNFESLQIDDKTWIADRKKRFPSVQRADLRREEQLERFKRGERLGKSNTKFGEKVKKDNISKLNRNCQNSESVRELKSSKRKSHFQKNENPKTDIKTNTGSTVCKNAFTDPYNSDPNCKLDIPAFKGTTAFYESIGDLSLFGVKNCSEEIEPEKEIDLYISDEDWKDESSKFLPQNPCIFKNALGSLIGAYNSESEEGEEEQGVPKNIIKGSKNKIPYKPGTVGEGIEMKLCETSKANNGSPAESALKPMEEMKDKSQIRRRKRKHNNTKSNNPVQGDNGDRKKPQVVSFKKRKLSLLEKLLEPDIIHERNVILQCVRYVVQNNYFEQEKISTD